MSGATSSAATLATSDSTSGRDSTDRWKQRTIQRSGSAAKTQSRAFDAAGRLTMQSGLGFSSAGSYTYDANSGRKTAESLPLALGGEVVPLRWPVVGMLVGAGQQAPVPRVVRQSAICSKLS